jgi:hypothetical protein
MSVISQGKLLFCEGKPDSLDYAILSRLVNQSVTIIPAEGKQGLKAFAKGRLSSYSRQSSLPRYLIFRDRDFDASPPNSPQLIPLASGNQLVCTYRVCIENYVLEATLLHQYWRDRAITPKWQYGPSPTLEDLKNWIETGARSISDYQAVRWALASLIPTSGWPKVETSLKGSGELPQSLQLDDCKKVAEQLIAKFEDAAKPVNLASFEHALEKYLTQFGSLLFWQNQDYLVWFHGKDLKKAMQKLQPKWISLDKFCEWAATKMDYRQHPDLMELSERIQSL